jgi:L,D-peptidoglycan transpeptidase YkuD (ErfK/YbiS/YcfS/YnhG family)
MLRSRARRQGRARRSRSIAGTTFDQITVTALPGASSLGRLEAGGRVIRCALGRGGIGRSKREGDGVTPAGVHPLRRLWYRGDRHAHPATRLPVLRIGAEDGWCDASGDRNYNRHVRLPYAGSHEAMRRTDALYDHVIEIGFNDARRVQGGGSAIFLHVARPGLLPTEGCIALPAAELRKLLPRLGPRTRIVIR